MSKTKEVRVKNVNEKTIAELNNVARYYGNSMGGFVRHLIKDYLEKCPKHIKETPLIDRE